MRALRPMSLRSESTSRSTIAPQSPMCPASPSSTLLSSAPTLVPSLRRMHRHRSVCSNQTDSATTVTTMTEPSAWQLQLTASVLSRAGTPDSTQKSTGDSNPSSGRRHSSPAVVSSSVSPSPSPPMPEFPQGCVTRARSTAAKVAPAPAISIRFDHHESDRSFSRWLQQNDCSCLGHSISHKPSASSLSTVGHFDTYVDQHFSRISDSVQCLDKLKYNYQEDRIRDDMCTYGLALFIFGFVFPPAWWLGSVFPRSPVTDMQRKWRRVNRLMSFGFSLVVLTAILTILVVWRLQQS
jgi:hypothetical protein